ncbi:MAG: peptidylprolyl isomerase [bacterium]
MSAAPCTLARIAAPGFFAPFVARLACVALLLGLGACSTRSAPPLVARVNGEPITVAQWNLERRFTGPQDTDGAQALDDLVDSALILQQGRRLGLRFGSAERDRALAEAMAGSDPEVLKQSLQGLGLSLIQWQDRVVRAAKVDAAISLALDPGLKASRQEILDRYWDHLLQYRSPARRVLRQIYTHRRSAAESALNALELGEPFAKVAAAQGQGPEAAQGGLLGAIARNELPKALARVAWKLKPGTYSPIVASHWGYHIFYNEGSVPADSGSPEEAAPRARADLLLAKEQLAYRNWLAHLRETAVIKLESAAKAPEPVAKGKP